MRSLLTFASLLSSAALVVGCATKPRSVRVVDESVLPAQAKALLSPEAQLTRVEEETYSKGTKVYVMHYTMNGNQQKIKYNPKDQTTPTGVFEHVR